MILEFDSATMCLKKNIKTEDCLFLLWHVSILSQIYYCYTVCLVLVKLFVTGSFNLIFLLQAPILDRTNKFFKILVSIFNFLFTEK